MAKKDNTIWWVIGVIAVLVIVVGGGFGIFGGKDKPDYRGCSINSDCEGLGYPAVCDKSTAPSVCRATGGLGNNPIELALAKGISFDSCVDITSLVSGGIGRDVKKYVRVTDISLGEITQEGIRPVMLDVKGADGTRGRWDLNVIETADESICRNLENQF